MRAFHRRALCGRRRARSDDGRLVAVVRPHEPHKALAVADAALRSNDGALFTRLPSECGEYTFMGWMAEGHPVCIVDRRGDVLGVPLAGDSFVSFDEQQEANIEQLTPGVGRVTFERCS